MSRESIFNNVSRWYSVAFLLCSMTLSSAATASAAEPWMRVFVGQSAYVGISPYQRPILCDSVNELYQYDWQNGDGCKVTVPYGTLAKIIAVTTIQSGDLGTAPSTYVELEGLDKPWAAWSSVHWLTPVVPIGTSIALNREGGILGGAKLYLKLAPDGGSTKNFGKSANAIVVSQKGRLLRVRITTGIAKGVDGLVGSTFVSTDLAPSGLLFAP